MKHSIPDLALGLGLERILRVMQQLRDKEDGCPWDVEQTFETIVPYTIEEAYEVADAIERKDTVDLREELGDLLLQVVFHAQMAQEAGLFSFDDVANGIADKMIHRHPHVFGDKVYRTVQARDLWDKIMQQDAVFKAIPRIILGSATVPVKPPVLIWYQPLT